MWCTHCKSDVPADFGPDQPMSRCARCGRAWPGRDESDHAPADAATTSPSQASQPTAEPAGDHQRPSADDWEIEDTLENAKRALRRSARLSNRYQRVDAAHDGTPGDGPTPPRSKPTPRATPGGLLRRLFAWLALCVGSLGLSFGLVVLGLAAFGQRGDLTALGIGAAMIGQVCLMAGAVAWMDRRASSTSPSEQEEPTTPIDQQREATRPPWTPSSDEALIRTLELFPLKERRQTPPTSHNPGSDERRSA